MNDDAYVTIEESLDKLELLSDMYNDFSKKEYSSIKDADIAKLKMDLLKKEMLVLNYKISKALEKC